MKSASAKIWRDILLIFLLLISVLFGGETVSYQIGADGFGLIVKYGEVEIEFPRQTSVAFKFRNQTEILGKLYMSAKLKRYPDKWIDETHVKIKPVELKVDENKNIITFDAEEMWPHAEVKKIVRVFLMESYVHIRYMVRANGNSSDIAHCLLNFNTGKLMDKKIILEPGGVKTFSHKGGLVCREQAFMKGGWIAYQNNSTTEGLALLFHDLSLWSYFMGSLPLGKDQLDGGYMLQIANPRIQKLCLLNEIQYSLYLYPFKLRDPVDAIEKAMKTIKIKLNECQEN
ncbi:MAG: hypothetical protein PHV34_24195 [Verrucomicrobiae bacterium]|nr:hypothetical protein [Verrucomicrobiae bacterium]